jgi:hypothetical protein
MRHSIGWARTCGTVTANSKPWISLHALPQHHIWKLKVLEKIIHASACRFAMLQTVAWVIATLLLACGTAQYWTFRQHLRHARGSGLRYAISRYVLRSCIQIPCSGVSLLTPTQSLLPVHPVDPGATVTLADAGKDCPIAGPHHVYRALPTAPQSFLYSHNTQSLPLLPHPGMRTRDEWLLTRSSSSRPAATSSRRAIQPLSCN